MRSRTYVHFTRCVPEHISVLERMMCSRTHVHVTRYMFHNIYRFWNATCVPEHTHTAIVICSRTYIGSGTHDAFQNTRAVHPLCVPERISVLERKMRSRTYINLQPSVLERKVCSGTDSAFRNTFGNETFVLERKMRSGTDGVI